LIAGEIDVIRSPRDPRADRRHKYRANENLLDSIKT